MSLRADDYLIDDSTHPDAVYAPVIDGEAKGLGLTPRDYAAYPEGYLSPPSEITIIPRSEWSERIKDLEAKKSLLSHLRGDWPALDQNGQGYCWAYSTTSAVMLLRSVMNQPHVRLSAHAIGCKVKNFRNEGGWCGLSAKFHREHGCPSVEKWAEKSMSRSNDNSATWENAALHKTTEEWVDLNQSVYDQNLSFDQVITCYLSRLPCAVDFNWWGHSVCGMDPVDGVSSFNDKLLREAGTGKLLTAKRFDLLWRTEVTGGYGQRILNSWSNGWGTRGTGVLAGNKAIPNGAVCLRATVPSDN